MNTNTTREDALAAALGVLGEMQPARVRSTTTADLLSTCDSWEDWIIHHTSSSAP